MIFKEFLTKEVLDECWVSRSGSKAWGTHSPNLQKAYRRKIEE